MKSANSAMPYAAVSMQAATSPILLFLNRRACELAVVEQRDRLCGPQFLICLRNGRTAVRGGKG